MPALFCLFHTIWRRSKICANAVSGSIAARFIWTGESRTVIRDYMASLREAKAVVADLEDTKTRRGNGKIRFQGLEFLSPDGISQS